MKNDKFNCVECNYKKFIVFIRSENVIYTFDTLEEAKDFYLKTGNGFKILYDKIGDKMYYTEEISGVEIKDNYKFLFYIVSFIASVMAIYLLLN
ncbi:hypothetical protein [Seonamhaeicola sp.]|uniref:hypothetical protein n=1 Tax=Seonamhaeicola sp. TaxID=1912245 RepID=UPI003566855A